MMSFSSHKTRKGENEVMMSCVVFTIMVFADIYTSNGWMMTLRKAVYKMRTNVDRLRLLVFWKGGREAFLI